MIQNALPAALPGRAQAAGRPGLPGKAEALDAARKFEAFFVELLLQEMSADLGEGGFFGESTGSELQQGLFNTMLSEEITVRGPGLGLADRLVEEWVARGMVRAEPGEPAGRTKVSRG